MYFGIKPLIAVRSNENQLQIGKINKDETMQKHLIKVETKINLENQSSEVGLERNKIVGLVRRKTRGRATT